MFDKALAIEILKNISESLRKISERFEGIKSPEEFVSSPAGTMKLDAICMQLIVIGESLKNLDKITDSKLLVKYPEIEWVKVKGLRDVISHHYFDVNEEAIFDICKNKIDPLSNTIDKILREI